MRRALRVCAALFPLLSCACGASLAPERETAVPPTQAFPLAKVELYEAGIAYLERAGTAPGDVPISLVVPEPHLDDALRTLTVLSGGSRSAPSFTFESVEAREAVLARASFSGEGLPGGFRSLIETLVSSEVEIVAKTGRASGRLVNVSDAPPIPLANLNPKDPASVPETMDDFYVTLANQEHGLFRFRGSEITRFRPLDPARRQLIERALDDPQQRVSAPAHPLFLRVPKGQLRVGYVAEAPVWRTTYRLVLPGAGTQASLWAGALVHNDSDERWSNVELTLASHRPDSYLTRFASPAYARRDPVMPSATFSPQPQLAPGNRTAFDPPTLESASAKVEKLTVRQIQRQEESGSFVYPVRQRLGLEPHTSTVVPFLETRIEARPVVWFSGPNRLGKRSVRLQNTSPQTLPEGTIACFGPAGFAGEAVLPRLLPGGARTLWFADDLDVNLELSASETTSRLASLTFDGETLEDRTRVHYDETFEIANRKPEPVRVGLQIRRKTSAQTRGFDALEDEDGAVGYFDVAANQTVKRTVATEDEVVSRLDADDLSSEYLHELAAAPFAAPWRAALEATIRVTDRIEANTKATEDAEGRVSELDEEISQTRTDLSEAAKAASTAAREFFRRLSALERERERLRTRIGELPKENERLVEVVRRELRHLPKPVPTPK